VIAFGTSIAEPDPYRRHAAPGIRRAAEPDSEIYAFAAVGPISRTGNLLLDAAARRDDLEALVLVDTHVEIVDPDFCRKVRHALSDPDVAIVGCAGAIGVRTIAWWEGRVSSALVVHRYGEHYGGELPGFSWSQPGPAPAEVDVVDGLLLVLSPWAVRNLRFDESLRNHGYDLDLCREARRAGRRVMTADLRVVHHRSLDLIGDIDLWVESHIHVAEKWNEDEADDDTWRRRARRAEAEREAARAVAYSNGLSWDARLAELERAMEAATATTSWRVTAPLRRLNLLRARAAERLRRRSASAWRMRPRR